VAIADDMLALVPTPDRSELLAALEPIAEQTPAFVDTTRAPNTVRAYAGGAYSPAAQTLSRGGEPVQVLDGGGVHVGDRGAEHQVRRVAGAQHGTSGYVDACGEQLAVVG
jgi:hypothetical protein